MSNQQEFDEAVSTFVRSGVKDASGREWGYVVELWQDKKGHQVRIQKARRVAPGSHDWAFYGPLNRPETFSTQEAATAYGFSTANKRVRLIQKKAGV